MEADASTSCCNVDDSKCLVRLQEVAGRWHCGCFIAGRCGLYLKALANRAPALGLELSFSAELLLSHLAGGSRGG